VLQNSLAEQLRFFSGGHFQLAERGQLPLAHSKKISSIWGSLSSGAKGAFWSGLSNLGEELKRKMRKMREKQEKRHGKQAEEKQVQAKLAVFEMPKGRVALKKE
jgi:hypothetical protein